jgi:hypothetical protein
MKKQAKSTLPELAKGQLWKMKDVSLHIVHLGKRLVHYRMLRQLGQMRRTQISAFETVQSYLRTHAARLQKSSSRS